MRKAIVEIHWTFRDTREDRHRSVPVGTVSDSDCPEFRDEIPFKEGRM